LSHRRLIQGGFSAVFTVCATAANAGYTDMQTARLQIVMVGRPEVFADLEDALEETPPIIRVNQWKNGDDIANYVESAVKKSRALSRAPQSLREEIIKTMVRNAQGMFLWAYQMIQELSKHSRANDIRECLRRAPKGLYEMFRHVLESFSASLLEEQSEDLNTILAWVACAARPLHLGEIDAILRLKSPEGDGVFGLESMLREQFASFLNVVREDGLTTADLQVVGDSLLRGFTGEHEDEKEKDVQDESNFDSNPLTTEVVFCHASIGDFFRAENEGKRSAKPGCPAVGVDIVASRVNTFRTCLQLICNKDTFSSLGQSPSLRDYALGFWDEHLKSTARHAKTLDGRDRDEIGTLLLKVLSDEHHIAEWSGLKTDKFLTPDILHAILAFLENDEFRESLPAETRDWVNAAMANPAELFVPVARLAAVKWLQDPIWDPCICMGLIYRIITMLKGEPIDQLPECPSAETIISVAEWAGLEKAAEWHRRLAMCLREFTHFEEAKEHFQIALDLDDQLLSARAGLAIIHTKQKQHEKSLELYKMNLSIMENLLQSGKTGDKEDPHSVEVADVVDCFNCIAQESLSMGDKQSALIYSRKAVEMSKEEHSSLFSYIQIVAEDKNRDNQEIMHLLKSMDVNVKDHDYTHLTQCLFEKANQGYVGVFYMTIASAAKSAGELEWLENAYERAIVVARKQQKSVIAFSLIATLADLYMAYDNKETNGLDIWKAIIYFPGTFMQGNLQMKLLQTIVCKNCGIYLLTAALEAGRDTAKASRYIEMLEDICKHKGQHLEGIDETLTDNHVGAFLGRWYYLNGQEAKARPYFLPYIRRAVLADGKFHDPMNEYNMYYAFAHVLLGVGDDSNAIAVFLGPHLRLGWLCAGGCGRMGEDYTGVSVCRHCTADLCDDCAQQLDEGKTLMINGYCRPNHSRLRIPPAAKIPESGEVCLGDEIIPWKDFVAPIKRQWGLN
jgi:tetratricopeptide (TPR) repeat protein